jgi:P pilus assembly chaperone PapD
MILTRQVAQISLGVVVLSFLFAIPLKSVSVSPMAVYIDHRTRSGELTLFNPGTTPEEIRIDFAFGYPQTDESGRVVVKLSEEAPDSEPSAVPWLSAFPQRLRLQPGQRQTVRFLARPPADLPEGEYWARARIHAESGQPPLESRQENVGVQITLNTVVVVAVNYRNGEMSTGVVMDASDAWSRNDTTFHEVHVERTGNAAFLGRLLIELLGENGDVLDAAEEVLPVYRSMDRRFIMPPVDNGVPVRVRYTVDTERDDLPPGGVIPAERVVREVTIR